MSEFWHLFISNNNVSEIVTPSSNRFPFTFLCCTRFVVFTMCNFMPKKRVYLLIYDSLKNWIKFSLFNLPSRLLSVFSVFLHAKIFWLISTWALCAYLLSINQMLSTHFSSSLFSLTKKVYISPLRCTYIN